MEISDDDDDDRSAELRIQQERERQAAFKAGVEAGAAAGRKKIIRGLNIWQAQPGWHEKTAADIVNVSAEIVEAITRWKSCFEKPMRPQEK